MSGQETDNPFIERPDEHEVQGDDIYCWMPGNMDRQCGPDCVAFDQIYEDDQGKTTCRVLNIMRVLGVGVQVLAGTIRDQHTKAEASAKRAAVAQKVSEIPDPPEVR